MNKKKLKKKLCRKFKKLLIKHRNEMEIFVKAISPINWNKNHM